MKSPPSWGSRYQVDFILDLRTSIPVLSFSNRMQKQQPGSGSDDLFDVVDDQDRVIAVRQRREVHALGLLHRAVHILVFNDVGQLFLQKRSMKKDRQPGLWDSSASGHVDHGEDYDTAAIREFEEELGVKPPSNLIRWFKVEAHPETDHEFVWVYRARHNGPFRLHPVEIDDGGWFMPDQVEKWLTEKPQDFASAVPVILARARALGQWPG